MLKDELLKHEALHTTHLAEVFVSEHLVFHKAIAENPAWHKKATEAQEALAALYQMIGSED